MKSDAPTSRNGAETGVDTELTTVPAWALAVLVEALPEPQFLTLAAGVGDRLAKDGLDWPPASPFPRG